MVILKATIATNWSWWLILLPLYLPVTVTLAFILFIGFKIYRNTN